MGNLPGKPGCHRDVTHWAAIFPWKQGYCDATQGQGWHGAADALRGYTWWFSSHFAKWSCLKPFLSLSHCAQLLGCKWDMPGLCFGKGPQNEVGLEAEGKPSSRLSWVLWFFSGSLILPPLCPCLPPALHHKLKGHWEISNALTTSTVASSSFSSRGRILLSSKHWEEGERHEMINKSRTYP